MQENGRLRPLEPDSVSLEAFHGLLEEILAGRGAGHARDIVLFPLDWRIYMVKNVFDRICDFGANAVARYERHLDGAEREWLDKDGVPTDASRCRRRRTLWVSGKVESGGSGLLRRRRTF